MHLNTEELLDLAEGTRAESSAPHLATCTRCQSRLADLRATMSAILEVEAPEPSPLFWDHFSQRVHDAVAAEPASTPAERSLFGQFVSSRAVQASLVGVASLAVMIAVASRTRAPEAVDTPVRSTTDAATVESQPPHADLFADSPVESDPPLLLVATLAGTVDAGAGLAGPGSADHAVSHMNAAELRELQRLLQQEIAP
jgi:hypothetical protein